MKPFEKATQVIQLATRQNARIAVAESCTGGLLSSLLTEAPGASAVFWGGLVTYANEAKEQLLGVKPETLQAHGAVSEQTAQEMADGVCHKYDADLSISITGIAGPTGGSVAKPVGTVFIGRAFKGKVITEHHTFDGNRNQIRLRSAEKALDMMLEALSDHA